MMINKVPVVEPVQGFTERDLSSKAILNTDIDALLRYKIQKRKISDINKSRNELSAMQVELDTIRSDLGEIKSLLLKITKEREQT
jgi:hypothetical protein